MQIGVYSNYLECFSSHVTKIVCDFMREKQFALTNYFGVFESHLHEIKHTLAEYAEEWTLMKAQSQDYTEIHGKSVRIFRICEEA